MKVKVIGKMLNFAVLILVMTDQIIKLIIKNSFMGERFNIIGSALYFQPLHNIKLSWINSALDLNVGFLPHILTNAVILLLLVYIYRYGSRKYNIPAAVEASYICILSGAVCSFIDKLFWGGSLDFLGLFSWFIFDTKDLYISAGIAVFMMFMIHDTIRNPKRQKTEFNDDLLLVRDFLRFVSKDIKMICGKITGK